MPMTRYWANISYTLSVYQAKFLGVINFGKRIGIGVGSHDDENDDNGN